MHHARPVATSRRTLLSSSSIPSIRSLLPLPLSITHSVAFHGHCQRPSVLSSHLTKRTFVSRSHPLSHPHSNSQSKPLDAASVAREIRSKTMSGQHPDPTQIYPNPPFNEAKEQDWPGSDSKMNPTPDWGQDSYKGSDKLKGQVALITGGDSGIGRAVAIAFSREGCDVAISYLPQEQGDAEDCKKMVEASGKKCLLLPGDLCQKEQCSKIVEETVAKLGKLNILVLNHAFQGKSVSDISKLDYDRVMRAFQTNIISFFEITKAALNHLQRGSSIITTGSIQAYRPSHGILDYASTKAAIVGFTKGLSQELMPKGIRVNCVAPGPIWTPLVAASFPDEKLKQFGGSYPAGRPGQPAELAGAYVYLASQAASYVNSEVLGVTGGGMLM